MAEFKRLEPLTPWIDYELDETPMLSEPRIKLRLRHVDSLEAAEESVKHGALRSPLVAAELALRAVAEWDLTEGGKPIPVTDENKAKFLRPLLGLLLKEEPPAAGAVEDKDAPKPPRKVLAYEIVDAAEDIERFLKN